MACYIASGRFAQRTCVRETDQSNRLTASVRDPTYHSSGHQPHFEVMKA